MQGELQSARQQVHKLQAAAEAAKLINDQQTADIQVQHLSCLALDIAGVKRCSTGFQLSPHLHGPPWPAAFRPAVRAVQSVGPNT